MSADSPENSASDRFEQVLADYLRSEEQGTPMDPQELIAANPEIAYELASFFRNRSAVQLLAELVQPHELSTVGSERGSGARQEQDLGVFGDYELEREIARGGMGVVFRAKQQSLQRTVALKMVLAGNRASEADLARFRREAEAAAKLEHPNIVPVYEVGEHDGRRFYTMKLIEGGDLNGQLAHLKQDPRACARLIETVARAVHFAHQHGILHRDLKPANILLDEAGQPHVADFGLARLIDSNDRMTQTGAALGTPGYMAPEQIRGEDPLTTSADVFSLGAILFACLTGEPPFHGANAWEAMQQALNVDSPSPRSLNQKVNRDLEIICKKALERNPAQRYESAAALADDLSRWLKHEPIMARPPSPLRRGWKWVRRHPASTAFLGMAMVMLLIIGGAYWRERMANVRAEGFLYRTLLALAEREWMAGAVYNAREALAKCPENHRGWEWAYVRRLSYNTPSHQLGSFSQPLSDGAFSADGSRVCAIDVEGHVRVWDSETRKEIAHIQVDGVGKIGLSPDGQQLAVAVDHTLHVFQVSDCSELWRWTAGGTICQLSFSPSGETLAVLVTPRSDATAEPPSASTELVLIRSEGGSEMLRDPLAQSEYRFVGFMSFTQDGQLLVYDSAQPFTPEEPKLPALRAYRADQGERVADIAIPRSTHRKSGESSQLMAISPDGKIVVFLYRYQNSLELRRIADGSCVRIPISTGDVSSFTFSSDSRKLAFLTSEMNLDIEDLKWHEAIPSFGPIFALAGKTQPFLLQAHGVDVETGKPVDVYRGFDGRSGNLRFSPDGRTLMVFGGTRKDVHEDQHVETFGQILLWDVEERATGRKIAAADGEAIHDVAVSPDGQLFVTAHDNNVVLVWDSLSGSLVREFDGFDQPVKRLLFGNKADEVFAASQSKVELLNCKTGKVQWSLANKPNEPAGNLDCAALRPDAEQIAVPYGQTVKVINTRSGATEFEVEGRAQFLTYSGDGKLLAIPYQFDLHGELKIVETKTGKVLHHFRSATRAELLRTGWGYLRARFSPDGRYVAAVGNIGGAHLYDLHRGKLVREMVGHGTTVWDAAFTSDTSRLATSGYSDGTVKLWSVATGEEVHTLRGHEGHVTGVAFSDDNARLFSADTDGVVRIWEAR